MEKSYASMPSPIACSTPIHQTDYYPFPSADRFDRNLDEIEQKYMSLIEEKEKTIKQKDEMIKQLVETLQIMKSKAVVAPTIQEEEDAQEEEMITSSQLLYCKQNAKNKPKLFVRNLLKLVFTPEMLKERCANGFGSRPALPSAKLTSVEKAALEVFPEIRHRDFVHIVNQFCCDKRKKKEIK